MPLLVKSDDFELPLLGGEGKRRNSPNRKFAL